MSHKAEIGWKRRTEEGVKVQVYAHHVGHEWRFFIREQRYQPWKRLNHPTLEDWKALLDGVERRVARRLFTPEDAKRIRKKIAESFPEADV